MTTNLPQPESTSSSSDEVRSFFDNFFKSQVTFPSNQIDAVVGYFLKRGFDEQSSKSTAIVLLNQSKIDNVNVFKLLDTLSGLNEVQLSSVVTEILNASREKTSILGFKLLELDETIESRNIKQ